MSTSHFLNDLFTSLTDRTNIPECCEDILSLHLSAEPGIIQKYGMITQCRRHWRNQWSSKWSPSKYIRLSFVWALLRTPSTCTVLLRQAEKITCRHEKKEGQASSSLSGYCYYRKRKEIHWPDRRIVVIRLPNNLQSVLALTGSKMYRTHFEGKKKCRIEIGEERWIDIPGKIRSVSLMR